MIQSREEFSQALKHYQKLQRQRKDRTGWLKSQKRKVLNQLKIDIRNSQKRTNIFGFLSYLKIK